MMNSARMVHLLAGCLVCSKSAVVGRCTADVPQPTFPHRNKWRAIAKNVKRIQNAHFLDACMTGTYCTWPRLILLERSDGHYCWSVYPMISSWQQLPHLPAKPLSRSRKASHWQEAWDSPSVNGSQRSPECMELLLSAVWPPVPLSPYHGRQLRCWHRRLPYRGLRLVDGRPGQVHQLREGEEWWPPSKAMHLESAARHSQEHGAVEWECYESSCSEAIRWGIRLPSSGPLHHHPASVEYLDSEWTESSECRYGMVQQVVHWRFVGTDHHYDKIRCAPFVVH